MKALTVRQPWASLIVHGPKWIETRTRRTNVRGRIGIIAGKSTAGIVGPDAVYEGGWSASEFGPYQAGVCIRSSDEGRRGDSFLCLADGTHKGWDPGDFVLPFGAQIGTVELYDCVPIVACKSDGGRPTPEQLINYGDRLRVVRRMAPPGVGFASSGYAVDICDEQLPYGDFTPGRWAWLLRDPQPCDPVPMRGALGWQEVES